MVGAWRLMFLPLGLAVQASAISHVRLQASAIFIGIGIGIGILLYRVMNVGLILWLGMAHI
jgi:hypothetical protein